VIFELAAVIAVGILILLEARKRHVDIEERWVILFAWLDRFDRNAKAFKEDIDGKFGKDLVEKLNAIFKLGKSPDKLTAGKDGKLHKINREY
jgi:hypothetical protein